MPSASRAVSCDSRRSRIAQRDELLAGGVAVARGTDQLDDRVEVLERREQALEDVRARLLLRQLVLGAAHDHLALVSDVVVDDLPQVQRARNVVDERDHVHAERRLHRRVLVELVEDDLRDRVALELDHEAHAALVRLVAQIGDLGDAFFVDQFGDLGHEVALAALLDHEGKLGDDDRLLAVAERLDVRAGLQANATATGLICVPDPAVAEDDPAGREVGALHVLHQAGRVDRGIVDVGDRGVDHLAQVVRRDVRGHADRDARRAVDEQVGKAGGQHERFLAGPVVVRREVDRVHVEVAQHLGGDAGEAGLGVAHRSGRVIVDRAEVALAVDELVAHREVLGHADERVVDCRVSVRVIVAHHLAHDLGALGVGAGGAETQLVHRVEHATVHRLEPVAHVGQRSPDDHRHRVVQVRRAHLLLQRTRFDVAADHISRCHVDCSPPGVPHTSRFATARAFSSMNSRLGSTWSPISLEKMRSATAASSSVTCASMRVAGDMVVSPS